MATITSTIKLVDQMSPTLRKISKAVDNLTKKVTNIGKAYDAANNRIISSNLKMQQQEAKLAEIKSKTAREELIMESKIQAIQDKTAQQDLLNQARIQQVNSRTARQELENEARIQQINSRTAQQELANQARIQQVTDRIAQQREISAARLAGINLRNTIQQVKYANLVASAWGKVKTSVGNAANKLRWFNASLVSSNKLSNGLNSAFRRILFTLGSIITLRNSLDIADSMMSTKARLDNINDGLYTTNEHLDIIYASAQRSRGSFEDTAAAVSKLGTVAGDAFNNVNELVAFTELMNKLYTIGGASAAEASTSMYQLTQAMAAGKLQGDELRSIMEGAPLLVEKIAKQLGVTKGEIKELGAEGKISADVIKAALFNSADEIEERFNRMPKTLSQIWTDIKNYTINAFRPVIDTVQRIINSVPFQRITEKIKGAIQAVANGVFKMVHALENPRIQEALGKIWEGFQKIWQIVLQVGQAAINVATWIINHWSAIGPVIYGLIAAMLVFKAVSLVTWIIQNWEILLVIAGIALLIASVYWLTDAYNQMTGSTVSGTGLIIGSLMFLGAVIWDIIYAVYALGYTIIVGVVAAFAVLCGAIEVAIRAVIEGFLLIGRVGQTALDTLGSKIWDTFVWLVDALTALWDNIKTWFTALDNAVYTSMGAIGDCIKGTLQWIRDVAKAHINNLTSAIGQMIDNIKIMVNNSKRVVSAALWNIVADGADSFNNLLDKADTVCTGIANYFIGVANKAIDAFNWIVDGWNNSIGKLGDWTITNPFNGEQWKPFGNVQGQHAGKFNEITSLRQTLGIGKADAASARAKANAALAGIQKTTDINWNTNPIPQYSDYVDWSSVGDAWSNAWKNAESWYKDIPEYNVDWGDWDAVTESWNSEVENLKNAIKEQWAIHGGLGIDLFKSIGDVWTSGWVNPMEVYKNGYQFGENIDSALGDIGSGFKDIWNSIFGNGDKAAGGTNSNSPNSLKDLLNGWNSGTGGIPGTIDDIADKVGKTSGSAGKTADSVSNIEDTLNLAEEELELLRKLAEQEVINRFTTAEIHVDMTNNNKIDSSMDLDGIVTHLSNKLYEELGVVASGVHY